MTQITPLKFHRKLGCGLLWSRYQWRHFEIKNLSLGDILKLQNFTSLGKCIAAIKFTFKDDSSDMHDMRRIYDAR